MAHNFHLKRVPFSHIDRNDSTYSLSYYSENQVPDALRDSILRVGVLHPPILKEKYADSFQVITGKKRLQVIYESLAQSMCNCLIVPPETPELTIFSIVLEDILTNRRPTPVEKALFFQKIISFLDPQPAADQFMPLMGLSPNPHLIKRFLALLDLEVPIIESLNNGILDEKVALELTNLSFRDRMVVFEIIHQLNLSLGKQKKLLAIGKELSIRLKNTVADILSCKEVDEIINHPRANIPQKSSNLMAWLYQKRSPMLSTAEKKFKQLIKELDLPKGANLNHSLSFEKDTLTLSLDFKDETQLRHTWNNIKESLSHS